jgi:Flp pilus assembly protein TadG
MLAAAMYFAGFIKNELARSGANAAGDAVMLSDSSYYLFRTAAGFWHGCREEQAAQIVEFAVSLPLLVVFVVGIFDFSGALSLKQKLTNAAREAARVAAADPSNDLSTNYSSPSSGMPVSISDAYQAVDNYFLSENINDCGLKGQNPSPSTGITWSSQANGNGCPGAVTLTINRGCFTQQPIGGVTTDVVSTCVTISYPYRWRFNSVITLLVPNAKYGSITYISANATAFNEN